jgi:hypothetical protein
LVYRKERVSGPRPKAWSVVENLSLGNFRHEWT